mgnify:CR=1 FL=1
MKPTAVILAAGLGTRMGELTRTRPKAMVRYRGKPALEHILDALQGTVDQCVIVVVHQKEQIIDHFKSRYKNVWLRYVEQPTLLGTTDATLRALPLVRESTLLMFCDNLFDAGEIRKVASTPDSLIYCRKDKPANHGLLYPPTGPPFSALEEKPALERWSRFRRNDELYNCFCGCVHLSHDFHDFVAARPLDALVSEHPDIPSVIGQYAQERPLAGVPIFWRSTLYTPLGTLDELQKAYAGLRIPCSETRALAWHSDGWMSVARNDSHALDARPLLDAEKRFLLEHYKPEGVIDVIHTAPWRLDNP